MMELEMERMNCGKTVLKAVLWSWIVLWDSKTTSPTETDVMNTTSVSCGTLNEIELEEASR